MKAWDSNYIELWLIMQEDETWIRRIYRAMNADFSLVEYRQLLKGKTEWNAFQKIANDSEENW